MQKMVVVNNQENIPSRVLLFVLILMMSLTTVCCSPSLKIGRPASPKVININFYFTPYTEGKNNSLEVVKGRIEVSVNEIHFAGENYQEDKVMKIFGEVVGGSIISADSFLSLLKKGKNKLHIDFKPVDKHRKYKIYLKKEYVCDEVKVLRGERFNGGSYEASNICRKEGAYKTARGDYKIDLSFDAPLAAGN